MKVLSQEMMDLSNEVFVDFLRPKKLQWGGLSRLEFAVLREVGRQGQASVKELRERLGVAACQLTRIVNRLQGEWDDPLVTRELGKRDRRLTILKLTPSGQKAMRRHLKERTSYYEAALRILKPKEAASALKFIRLMREAFEKQRKALHEK
ncbi:MAG: MarR family transcriptional regulator [Phycisphaerae bacterium]|nr:MarR family transcriptional regulator [Phycisphaerae bacterium]